VPLSPSDLFLSPHLTTAQAEDYLASLGFHDPAAAERNLRTMAEEIEVREALGRMAEALVPALTGTPSPDQALVGFSRYLAARMARGAFLDYLSDDPVALQVLVEVLGTSPFLSEILIRNPEYLYSVVAEIDRGRLGAAPPPAPGERQASLDSLKRFKRRELLRIAARDILGREEVESATAQLSDLASVLIDRNLLFADVMIESSGGASPVRCHGHRKRDALEMKRLIEQFQSDYYRDRPEGGGRPTA